MACDYREILDMPWPGSNVLYTDIHRIYRKGCDVLIGIDLISVITYPLEKTLLEIVY